MKATIYKSIHAEAVLSTDNPASSYGIPVLEIAGKAYGPMDPLPSGLLAGELARRYLAGTSAEGGEWVRSDEGRTLAGKFLLAGVDEIGNRTGTP